MRAVELVVLPLVIVRPVTPVLSRIARPVPVCSSVPRFVKVASLPLIVTAFVPPLTVNDAVDSIVPVCPVPGPKVCAEVEGAVISKLPAEAVASVKKPRATSTPV